MRPRVPPLALLLLAAPAFPAGAAAQADLSGTWASVGYGNAYRIEGDALRSWEVTRATCVEAGRAERNDRGWWVGDDGRRFRLTPDGADAARLRAPGTASDIELRRIDALPAVCARPTPNTPEANFEVFWRTWDEQYALWQLKDTDWVATVERVRPRVSAATSPGELFALMREMIAPFEDAHASLGAPDLGQRFIALRAGTDRLLPGGIAAFNRGGRERFTTETMPAIGRILEHRYLRTSLRACCKGQVQYALVDDSTGYLRILSFSGWSDGGFGSQLASLHSLLDEAFANPALNGLIIDVRINFGGSDALGLALASRLTSAPYVAYIKTARADPVDRAAWTPGQTSTVGPSTRASFHGPVVQLTGPLTISAGETFTQALMGRSPRVVRVGESTQGVFSDVLGRRLPNGWTFGLPNEVFLTPDGHTFDGPGIPPDVQVSVFPGEDLEASVDRGLERALEILGEMRASGLRTDGAPR